LAKKKPGKYDHIIGGLDQLPPEDPKYQDKINLIKEKIKAETVHTPESLVKEYAVVRSVKEDLKDELSIIQEKLTAIEQLLYESYDHDEFGWGTHGASDNTILLTDGRKLQVLLEPVGKVQDKEAFRLWCIKDGLESSLQLWPSTMNSIAKERAEKGQPAPDGVKVYFQPKIKWYGNND